MRYCGQLVPIRFSSPAQNNFTFRLSNIRIIFGGRQRTTTTPSAKLTQCRSEAVPEGVAAPVPIHSEVEAEEVVVALVAALVAVVVRDNASIQSTQASN